MVKHTNRIEKYLYDTYSFRRNPVLDRTEFKKKSDTRYQLLTERDLNTIHRHLKAHFTKKDGNETSFRFTTAGLKNLLNSDFVEDIDPFKKYFESLPIWDGKLDYIQALADTVITTEQDLWREYFKKWLVAVVACALDEDKVNHQVLVLSGAQGAGKSTWLNALLPSELKGYIYSGIVEPNNKDTLVNLAENLFINLDELENLNKTELGSLKSLITQSSIKLRKAYAVFNENLRRRASFMGSVNDAEFLNDTTGNRRYLCFTCQEINYMHEADLNLVYSQAYTLYMSRFKYYFDATDIPALERMNSQYIRISVEEDLLLKYFEPAERMDENIKFLTPVEIVQAIQRSEGQVFDRHSSLKKIGQALMKHKFKKVSKNGRKPYIVRWIDEHSTAEVIGLDEPDEIPKQQVDPSITSPTYHPKDLPEDAPPEEREIMIAHERQLRRTQDEELRREFNLCIEARNNLFGAYSEVQMRAINRTFERILKMDAPFNERKGEIAELINLIDGARKELESGILGGLVRKIGKENLSNQ